MLQMSQIDTKDFYTATSYNPETKTQIWMSQIADSHDNICCCSHPFAHLLASIFPVGHQDRNKTINQILLRDYREKCHSGGEGEENHGLGDGEENQEEHIQKEEKLIKPDTTEEDLALAAAVADAER